jgi:hypothetical protein
VTQLVIEGTLGTPARRGRPGGTGTGRAPGTPVREHELRAVVAVVVAVVAVLLVATWSLAQGWGRGPVVGPGELALDGGIVRVEGALSAARPQHAMPGMGTDEDPVADGERRVSVDVTLLAGAGEMRYAAEQFALQVDGEPATRLVHRDVLPGDTLPPGTQLSGTLMFDVPADATVGLLSYAGGPATEVVLPAEEPVADADAAHAPTGEGTDAGHGAAGHDAASAPATVGGD